jgi:membrane fusion protein, macrolide-specific efflux system
MKKTYRIGVMVVVICLFMDLDFTACNFSKKNNLNSIPVLITTSQMNRTTVKVKRGNIQKELSINGSIVPTIKKDMTFTNIAGYLSKLNVKANDPIKKGEIIAELDSQDVEYEIKQEKVKVQQAQFDYDQAVKNKAIKMAREKALYDSNFLPKAQFEDDEIQFDSAIEDAKSNLETEKLNLEKVNEDLNRTVLRSDITGVVTYVPDLKLYQHIDPFQVIATVADGSSCQVQCNEKVQVQQEDVVSNSDDKDKNAKINLYEKLPAGVNVKISTENSTYDGQVIGNIIDQTDTNVNKKCVITIKFNKQPDKFKFEDNAVITYIDSMAKDVLLLPLSAVIIGAGNHPYVKVLKDGVVSEKYVDIGICNDKYYEITSGVEEGDDVISN